MPGVYGGLICILMYAVAQVAPEEEIALITQNNIFILTDTSLEIFVQEEV